MTGSFRLRIGIISVVGIISEVIGGHFGGGDHFDGGDHFGGGTPLPLNPLSPNSDQHKFSPNKIHRLLRAKSMRINRMITKRKGQKGPRKVRKCSKIAKMTRIFLPS